MDVPGLRRVQPRGLTSDPRPAVATESGDGDGESDLEASWSIRSVGAGTEQELERTREALDVGTPDGQDHVLGANIELRLGHRAPRVGLPVRVRSSDVGGFRTAAQEATARSIEGWPHAWTKAPQFQGR